MFGLWPVIERELRTQARHRQTYWTRVLTAGMGILAGFYLVSLGVLDTGQGYRLFNLLAWLMQGFIWLGIPLMAADCISKERREGTMPLLFLTSLKPWQIVFAKGWVHGWRAVFIIAAVLPIMSIAFLLGGVDINSVFNTIILQICSICLALSAGILGSVVSKKWSLAVFYAITFAFFLSYAFVEVTGGIVRYNMGIKNGAGYYGYTASGIYWGIAALGNHEILNMNYMAVKRPPYVPRRWPVVFSIELIVSVLLLLLTIVIASLILKRVWKENPPSPRVSKMQATMVKPVIGEKYLKQLLKRSLDKNPMGWLELRSWTGRTLSWGLFTVLATVYSYALESESPVRVIESFRTIVTYALLLVIAGNSASSFYRERETGAMELILVSPMTIAEIILGRLRSLWRRFLPSLLLLLCVWLYIPRLTFQASQIGEIAFATSSYFLLPVIGLYFSLRCANFMSAIVATILTGLVLPGMAVSMLILIVEMLGNMNWGLVRYFLSSAYVWNMGAIQYFFGGDRLWIALMPCLFQTLTTLFLGRRLYKKLERREISFISKS